MPLPFIVSTQATKDEKTGEQGVVVLWKKLTDTDPRLVAAPTPDDAERVIEEALHTVELQVEE